MEKKDITFKVLEQFFTNKMNDMKKHWSPDGIENTAYNIEVMTGLSNIIDAFRILDTTTINHIENGEQDLNLDKTALNKYVHVHFVQAINHLHSLDKDNFLELMDLVFAIITVYPELNTEETLMSNLNYLTKTNHSSLKEYITQEEATKSTTQLLVSRTFQTLCTYWVNYYIDAYDSKLFVVVDESDIKSGVVSVDEEIYAPKQY